jgi:hypothetical protein
LSNAQAFVSIYVVTFAAVVLLLAGLSLLITAIGALAPVLVATGLAGGSALAVRSRHHQ